MAANAQNPVIEGDTKLCPNSNGTATITGSEVYDTYQWYFRNWPSQGDYTAIAGATLPSFTYDWYTYSVTELKVKVTKDGQEFESNALLIDSWDWTGLSVIHSPSEHVVFDPDLGGYLLCPGDTIGNSINEPFTVAQWYKDGLPIQGASATSYEITEPGDYLVMAAPYMCPENFSPSLVIHVLENPDCIVAGINDPKGMGGILLYPNPTRDILTMTIPQGITGNYLIYDLTGKELLKGTLNADTTAVDISGLRSGSYLVRLTGENGSAVRMVIRE
ncbi:Por secretion system C-terminal sorting domain containing protein [Flavobacterium beibuense]|uniref:Por secretion system C-terminal sorting domain containing protein n=2 Tax=Flavobacterium beibuense TaxID=657326 RepID=A0A444WEF9_9FLAO|nr:Por secretion system C-terminal sorting domain containing protein [Flavobacterium beibuense]